MAAAFPEDDDGGTSSVHITEFGDVRVNPQPIVQDEEETDVLLEEYLSPRKLVSSACSVSILETIYISIHIK